MNRKLLLSAFGILAAPILAASFAPGLVAQDANPARPGIPTGAQSLPVLGFDPDSAPPFDMLGNARRPAEANQVRIRRRVVIRIGPARSAARQQMIADLPRRTMRRRYAEADYGDCIAAGGIVGVQPTSDNRLLIFSRPDMILAAELEDGCTARAFYAGFYAERSEDGRICVQRDRLQSRAGANCQVENFTRLVAASR